MGETVKRGAKGICVIIFLNFLSIMAGYFMSPYIYGNLYSLPIYACIAKLWTLITSLNIGILDLLSPIGPAVRWVIKKTKSSQFILKLFIYVISTLTSIVAMWASFVIGISTHNTIDRYNAYEIGDQQYFYQLNVDNAIFINITLQDDSKPINPDCKYKIMDVQPQELPLWKKIVDFPRYIVCQWARTSPIEVIVKPVEKSEVMVRFSDPLISYGEKAVIWTSYETLLGDISGQNPNEFTPFFEYSFDGIEWAKHEICGIENRFLYDQEYVYLLWSNTWERSHRDLLNQQFHHAKAGDVVDFYFPGERVMFNLDMLHDSEALDAIFLDKLRAAEEYQLSLESLDSQTVWHDNEIKTGFIISASASPELSPCIIKKGAEIIYHCYDGAIDLGYYHIEASRKEVTWEEATLQQNQAITLRLDID